MRLFLAIYPPKEILNQLRDVQREFFKEKRNLKTIPVDQLHLTLKFIGPGVSESSFELIKETLKANEGNYGPTEIRLKKVQFGFDKQDFPSLLVVTAESNQSIINLSNYIHTTLKELKLRDTIRWKDKHSENFHITLARLKKTIARSSAKQLKDKVKTMNFPVIESFIATEMFLIESDTDNKTSQYKKIERIKL